jgi:hypothetical protein
MNTNAVVFGRPSTDPPSGFNGSQWQAVLAPLYTVIPSIIESDTSFTGQNHLSISPHELRNLYHRALCGNYDRFCFGEFTHFMALRPSDDPKFVATVKRTIERLPPGARHQLRFIIGFMLTSLGSIISTGYWTPLSNQSLPIRASILRSWQQSWFFLWPSLARIFITIGKAC